MQLRSAKAPPPVPVAQPAPKPRPTPESNQATPVMTSSMASDKPKSDYYGDVHEEEGLPLLYASIIFLAELCCTSPNSHLHFYKKQRANLFMLGMCHQMYPRLILRPSSRSLASSFLKVLLSGAARFAIRFLVQIRQYL